MITWPSVVIKLEIKKNIITYETTGLSETNFCHIISVLRFEYIPGIAIDQPIWLP